MITPTEQFLLLRCSVRHSRFDLQDGTQLQFKSALRKTYITADQGGAVTANKTQASTYETFKVRSLLGLSLSPLLN